MDEIIYGLVCLFGLFVLFLFVRAFFKWVSIEKERGNKIADEYKQSDAYKNTREKFLKDIDKKKGKK